MSEVAVQPGGDRPVGLVTRHILIDTSIYASARMDLGSRLFRALEKAVRDFGLIIHYNEVIALECGRQIDELVETISAARKKHAKAVTAWNHQWPARHLQLDEPGPIDLEVVASATRRAFFNRLEGGFGARLDPIDTIGVSDILARYSRREPPFHTPGSKEFPDALIIEASLRWARASGDRMFIVSGDQKMMAAAEFHPELIPMSSLADMLEEITKDRDPAVVAEANAIIDGEGFVGELMDALEAAVSSSEALYSGSQFHGGGANDLSLVSLDEFAPVQVVAFDAETITCVSPMSFTFQVDAEFVFVISYEQGDDERYHSQVFDESSKNRAYLILDRADRQLRSIELLRDITFGDPDD